MQPRGSSYTPRKWLPTSETSNAKGKDGIEDEPFNNLRTTHRTANNSFAGATDLPQKSMAMETESDAYQLASKPTTTTPSSSANLGRHGHGQGSPSGRASRRSPLKSEDAALGNDTNPHQSLGGVDLSLGQRAILCQARRCCNEATKSMLCPQHHRMVFGMTSDIPEMPRRVPMPMPPHHKADQHSFVLHPTFLKASQ